MLVQAVLQYVVMHYTDKESFLSIIWKTKVMPCPYWMGATEVILMQEGQGNMNKYDMINDMMEVVATLLLVRNALPLYLTCLRVLEFSVMQ